MSSKTFLSQAATSAGVVMEKSQAIGGGGFAYTRQNIATIEGSRRTLCNIVADESPSVDSFIREIEAAVRDSIIALQGKMVNGVFHPNPLAGQIMASTLAFSNTQREVHGYLDVPYIDPLQYLNAFRPNGGTDIESAVLLALSGMESMSGDLYDQDFLVNGVFICITDGQSFSHHAGPQVIKAKQDSMLKKDPATLESLTSVLVGVNCPTDGTLNRYLNDFKTKGGFTEYVALPDATPETIRQLVGIISKSVSSSSKSLGSGAAPSLNF